MIDQSTPKHSRIHRGSGSERQRKRAGSALTYPGAYISIDVNV